MSEIQRKYIHSINLNADSDFPYLVLNVLNHQSFPINPGFQVMHWHEDLQFIYVVAGDIEIKTLDSDILLNTNSGLFINKNVVHLVKNNNNCHYKSFIFPDYFLEFYGKPAQDFVENIVDNESISFYRFSKDMNSHRAVFSILKKLSELEMNKTEFYTYEVLVLLSTLWLEMQKCMKLPVQQHKTVIYNRMQKILEYIEEHYGEKISLDALANSANISKSECLRCFKATLQITPYRYLLEYRLSKAAELLINTDEPISKIADQVGFSQISHFGKCFKEKTGCSPKDYRRYNFK